jgi:hypothetical protein
VPAPIYNPHCPIRNPQSSIRNPVIRRGLRRNRRGAPPSTIRFRRSISRCRRRSSASRGNLARVRELVQQHRRWLKASFDWGYGDLGNRARRGGAHRTPRDRGTAPRQRRAGDAVSAAMLGQLDLVKAFIAATARRAADAGLHSISLLVHASSAGRRRPRWSPISKGSAMPTCR